MEQPYMLPILRWQYHPYWCYGDFRSQGISRHGMVTQSHHIPSPASEDLFMTEIVSFVNEYIFDVL